MNASIQSIIPPRKRYLFDTTVFIDFWRKNSTAKDIITHVFSNDIKVGYSIITEAELWVGTADKAKRQDTKIMLARFQRYPLTITIARRAGELKRVNGLCLMDGLIAATAEQNGLILISRNFNHYQSLHPTIISLVPYS